MAKYVKFSGGTDYCGTDYEDFEIFNDDITEAELDEISEDKARDNGKSYEYLINGWHAEEEPTEEELEDYYSDCYSNASWEYITEEEYKEEMGED